MATSFAAATSSSAAAATSHHHQHVTIRVLVAETGATFKITLPYSDLTVANLRSHIAAAVPPADQILLIGPPYKVPKDPIFQSEEILNSLRLGDIEDGHPMTATTTTTSTSTTSSSLLPRDSTTSTSSSPADENENNKEDRERSSSTSANTSTNHPSSLLKLPRRRLLTATSSGSSGGGGGARRIFLFSKAALLPPPAVAVSASTSSSSPMDASTTASTTSQHHAPPVVRLPPLSVTLPTEVPPGPSPLADALAAASASSSSSSSISSSYSSPLHQALMAYEGQFRMYLEQGRVLADAADVRLHSCITCLQEQAVMARALQAAASNLHDHSTAASKTRTEFGQSFQNKIFASHAPLLQGFEGLLQQLANIPLHPALVQAAAAAAAGARTSASTTSTTASTAIAPIMNMHTLLDTVPVERERNWMQQCQTSHSRLVSLNQQVEADFNQLFSSNSNHQEQDEQAILQLEQKWEQVQGIGRSIQQEQAQRMASLTACHSQVVKTILNAVTTTGGGGAGGSSSSDAAIQAAFVPLGALSEESSKSLVPAMMQADVELQNLQHVIAQSKGEWMQRIKVRLREISAAQSGIQKTLSNLSVLRDAVKHQCENMEHLEHVAELPAAYQHFLHEIQRRRAFGQAVSASTTALLERLAALREDEVKAREKFLRGPGRHLMPAFYEVFVPSLASPPPLFAPPQLQPLNEMDTLPHIVTTTATATVGGGSSTTATMMTAPASGGGGDYSAMQVPADQNVGVSSASSLTTSEPSSGGGGGGGGAQQQQQQQQQDQLIVSASEQSGNDLYLDPATGAAVEAEARTLAYENLVLRQALERLGGKPPRSYIQEARSSSSAAAAASAAAVAAACAREEKALADVVALKKELAESKARAEVATEALKAAAAVSVPSSSSGGVDGGGLCDKISHSSFQVGDVGLFMPTGRGSGGKRTYLAFHTKCPYRFLSTDNIKGTPDFVLGRIVYQEELVAGELGTDANPYGLPVGTKFWVLTVEVLTSQT